MNSVVRFFKNKNTVTVIGVLLIALILGFGYYYQVQKQVKPISVPVAAVTIQPRTEITSDMITYIEVPEAYVSENVVRNEQEIIAKYAQYNTTIPAGSMFYNETLTTKEMLPNFLLSLLKEGEVALAFNIGKIEGQKPPIMPGEKIDIYMKVTTEEGSIMFGKLLENLEILTVTDAEGRNVYDVTDGSRTAEYINFGVQEDVFLLLMRAQFLEVQFMPVQHGAWKNDENLEFMVTTQELIDYIKARTIQLSTDPVPGNNTINKVQ